MNGDHYEAQHSSLAFGCADSNHSFARFVLALIHNRKERDMQNPSSAYDADEIGGEYCALSAVSWAALFAGAFAILALTLILMNLGAGIGLSTISPWPNEGASAASITYMAAIWLIIVPIISCGIGGYLTGRLRNKWIGIHTHEVFFRDTAHGFLAWAVALFLGLCLVLMPAAALVGGVSSITGAAASHSGPGGGMDMSAYVTDSLFRSEPPSATPIDADTKAEAAYILSKGVKEGNLSDADRTYLGQLISSRTNVPTADAEKRVDDLMAQMRQTADDARKAAISIALYSFLSMLVGAFVASAAAAIGGRQRDEGETRRVRVTSD